MRLLHPNCELFQGGTVTETHKTWIMSGMPPFNPHHFLFSIVLVTGLAPRSCLRIKSHLTLKSRRVTVHLLWGKAGWMNGIMIQARLAHELPFGSSCCKWHRTDSQLRWKFQHWPHLTYFSCLLSLENKALDNYTSAYSKEHFNHTRQVAYTGCSPKGNFFLML